MSRDGRGLTDGAGTRRGWSASAWRTLDVCNDCGVSAGEPCRDLRKRTRPGSRRPALKLTPHEGRHMLPVGRR